LIQRGKTVVHQYVSRANIDHYLDLLDGRDLAHANRNTITSLLIDEEDRLCAAQLVGRFRVHALGQGDAKTQIIGTL
jgi:hypothetical protein